MKKDAPRGGDASFKVSHEQVNYLITTLRLPLM